MVRAFHRGSGVIAATLALAVLIGISLGLLGGGGSILTVPILIYVAGQDPKSAIAMSLVVVGVTSAAGAVSHARAGRIEWSTGLPFGAAGMVGGYAGGRIAEFVPSAWLLVAFAIMMAVTAVAMLRSGSPVARSHGHHERSPRGRIVLEGILVGAATGLVGAGGGFLVVPVLVLLGGMPMSAAVGTSLVVIAMKSGAALLGHLAGTSIDWALAAAVTGAAIVGSAVGGKLSERVSEKRLRRMFAWFVAAMAIIVLGEQVPAQIRHAVLTSPFAWILLAVAAAALRAAGNRGAVS